MLKLHIEDYLQLAIAYSILVHGWTYHNFQSRRQGRGVTRAILVGLFRQVHLRLLVENRFNKTAHHMHSDVIFGNCTTDSLKTELDESVVV